MSEKTTTEAQQLVKSLMIAGENSTCADCKKNQTKWASSSLGIFICLNCSGIHRSLGTHISFVRSCILDGWTPKQAILMRKIGNKIANAYWEARLPEDYMRPNPSDMNSLEAFIRAKYVNRAWAGPGEPPHLVATRAKAPAPTMTSPTMTSFAQSSNEFFNPSPPTKSPSSPTLTLTESTSTPAFKQKNFQPISAINIPSPNSKMIPKPPSQAPKNPNKRVNRFKKKPDGAQVVDQMAEMDLSSRPSTAPVPVYTSQVSIFDNLDFGSHF